MDILNALNATAVGHRAVLGRNTLQIQQALVLPTKVPGSLNASTRGGTEVRQGFTSFTAH